MKKGWIKGDFNLNTECLIAASGNNFKKIPNSIRFKNSRSHFAGVTGAFPDDPPPVSSKDRQKPYYSTPAIPISGAE